ncbi:hypothetical protein ACX80E_13875 [Arthrobacter sp. TMN-49]
MLSWLLPAHLFLSVAGMVLSGIELLEMVGSAAKFVIFRFRTNIFSAQIAHEYVKPSAVLGFYLRNHALGLMVLDVFLGLAVGAVTSGALVIAGLAGRKSSMPFEPPMLSWSFLDNVFGSQIGHILLSSIFL